MKKQTRRKFITDSAKITGAVIGTATLGQVFLSPVNIQLPESTCGSKNTDGYRILVAYASEFGTTGEVAEVIGEALCQESNTVETKWIKNVKEDLNNYDAVIIGSAIQYDKWMPEATEFVTANRNILSNLPVAYFFTCLALSKQGEKVERQAMAYSDKLYALVPQVKPVSIGRFAGVLDYSKMSLGFRLIARGIFAILGVQEGDYRDWDAIRSWAKGIHFKLSSR